MTEQEKQRLLEAAYLIRDFRKREIEIQKIEQGEKHEKANDNARRKNL
ncbi:hypothetical protein [Aeoliella mucimassa]|uniref:Uncharacterized protein n=1 Tax=Aeoliella mucimassa TaxID=2527972 RepID=A0A518AMG6_9BACT|nr:hypothetical protein [Aeoliella mucimassa]QDU55920.1 hypothetical protein Pan181_21220 [Aeoliella mucimassa]